MNWRISYISKYYSKRPTINKTTNINKVKASSLQTVNLPYGPQTDETLITTDIYNIIQMVN